MAERVINIELSRLSVMEEDRGGLRRVNVQVAQILYTVDVGQSGQPPICSVTTTQNP